MYYRRVKSRMNVEGDRLSNLPDDLLHNILAFIDVKQAIEISALSSRWRYVWTSMSCLTFSNEGFRTSSEFSKFVKHVLSARNNQTQVHSVKFSFSGKVNDAYSKRILIRIFSSHNVQQLDITCLPAKNGFNMTESHIPVFSSESLKNLTLSGCVCEHFLRAPHTWYLPALTTLYLRCVTLYGDNNDSDGLFSNCANLKNLTLEDCGTAGQWNDFSIRHDGLSNLTLVDGCEDVNVVTPQLQNLTIINWSRVHLVSAPKLASLHYKEDDDDIDCVPLKISTELLCLEKVDVCIQCSYESRLHTHRIIRLLQQLHSVKVLTLNLELVKLLSSFVKLLSYSHQPSPFTDLKSLKIYPADVTKPEITMSTEVKNYLLDGSQGATFTLVSYEERAVKNVTSVSKLMTELQVLLDQWKKSSELQAADTKMKWQFGGRMTRSGGAILEWVHKIVGASPPAGDNVDPPLMTRGESYWEGLNEQLEKGYKNFGRAISMLRKIEGELTKLPRSCRAKLQAQFSNLCAETDTIMDNMVDHLKIQCYKKPRLLS